MATVCKGFQLKMGEKQEALRFWILDNRMSSLCIVQEEFFNEGASCCQWKDGGDTISINVLVCCILQFVKDWVVDCSN